MNIIHIILNKSQNIFSILLKSNFLLVFLKGYFYAVHSNECDKYRPGDAAYTVCCIHKSAKADTGEKICGGGYRCNDQRAAVYPEALYYAAA